MKTRVTLLGIWNEPPAKVWTWLNDDGIKELKRLTGRKVDVFSSMKNGLNSECFIERGTELLRRDLEKLPYVDQVKYIKRIADDCFRYIGPLEKKLHATQKINPRKLTSSELAELIHTLSKSWPKVVMQCWYAVLMDIWYPGPYEKSELKRIISKPRDYCGHLHELSDQIERKLYEEVSKRINISLSDIYYMIQPEMISALLGSKIELEKIRRRTELYLHTSISGKTIIYQGAQAKNMLKKFIVPTIGKKTKGLLRGIPASAGKTRGKARVILRREEFKTFKQGEILIALTTMVDYLFIMKRSRGILTEFGGLTSHAAIVSRELKKPAVVGISGLINSIKTGDMVEIDANKGIVRKLL